MNESLPLHVSKRSAESAQAWFGLRLAASLTELQALRPRPDIDARLRFAREQALDTARRARLAAAPVVVGTAGGSAVFGGEPGNRTPWWLRLGSLCCRVPPPERGSPCALSHTSRWSSSANPSS